MGLCIGEVATWVYFYDGSKVVRVRSFGGGFLGLSGLVVSLAIERHLLQIMRALKPNERLQRKERFGIEIRQ